MKEKIETAIKSLAKRANNTHDANDALKYTQAILNAAHALNVISVLEVSR